MNNGTVCLRQLDITFRQFKRLLKTFQSINQSINLYRAIVQRRVLQCGYAESKRNVLRQILNVCVWCLISWATAPCVWMLRDPTRNLTYLLTRSFQRRVVQHSWLYWFWLTNSQWTGDNMHQKHVILNCCTNTGQSSSVVILLTGKTIIIARACLDHLTKWSMNVTSTADQDQCYLV